MHALQLGGLLWCATLVGYIGVVWVKHTRGGSGLLGVEFSITMQSLRLKYQKQTNKQQTTNNTNNKQQTTQTTNNKHKQAVTMPKNKNKSKNKNNQSNQNKSPSSKQQQQQQQSSQQQQQQSSQQQQPSQQPSSQQQSSQQQSSQPQPSSPPNQFSAKAAVEAEVKLADPTSSTNSNNTNTNTSTNNTINGAELSWEEEKQRGNELFKQKEYAKAIQAYTNALNMIKSITNTTNTTNNNHNQVEVICLCNRAQAYLNLQQPLTNSNCEAAIKDCTRALELEPDNVKALFRRATALEAMNSDTLNQKLANLEQALTDVRQIISRTSHAATPANTANTTINAVDQASYKAANALAEKLQAEIVRYRDREQSHTFSLNRVSVFFFLLILHALISFSLSLYFSLTPR